MIKALRSLVSGGRGGPAHPVPRARAHRVPQRRHDRAGAAAAYEAALSRCAPSSTRGAAARILPGAARADRPAARRGSPSLMGADAGDLALTGSTTDGVNDVLGALDLGPGDEVLTSDEEHPGVLAPLGALRERRGVSVRVAPFDELAARGRAGHPPGRLLARVLAHRGGRRRRRRWPPPAPWCCSTAPRASAPCRSTSPRSAVTSTRPRARSGCAAPTARLPLRARGAGLAAAPAWPGYPSARRRHARAGARPPPRRAPPVGRIPGPAPRRLGAGGAGRARGRRDGRTHDRAAEPGRATLAERLGERVRPRGPHHSGRVGGAGPGGGGGAPARRGVRLRELPGTGTVRASVGAWSSEAELDRLAELTCS